jgi:hypothetical protein
MYAFGRHVVDLSLLPLCFSSPQGSSLLRWRSRICFEPFSAPRRRPPTMAVTNGLHGFRSFSLRWVDVLVLVTSSDMYATFYINDTSQWQVLTIPSRHKYTTTSDYNGSSPTSSVSRSSCTSCKTPMLTKPSFLLHGHPRPHPRNRRRPSISRRPDRSL